MDQSSGEQCWPTTTHKMMQQDWHGRSHWEWGDLYASSASQADRFERLPMAEWAGSDQDLSFNNHHHLHLGKELNFKTISAADPDTAAVMVAAAAAAAAAAGSGLGEDMGLSLMEDVKGVKIFDCLKNTSDDNSRAAAAAAISSGWLVEAQSMSNGSSCVVGGAAAAAANTAKNGFLMVGLGSESDTSNGNGGCGVFHHGGGQLGNDVQGDSLTCLKLGKRQYYEDNANAAAAAAAAAVAADSVNQSKPHVSMVSVPASPPPQISSSTCSIGTNAVSSSYKKPRASPSSASQPPRCQVEGCNLVLTNAKDYHRRHKVCEVHAKSPKVIVNSIEQRFCQQCSRFHVISEFDDAKRSCRRRLAGHNERRRKNASDALNISSVQEEKRLMNAMGERLRLGSFALPCFSSARRALSLLSSSQKPSWMPDTGISGDLSYRSSMALNELIAQNRAAAAAATVTATATQAHSQSLRFSEDPQQQQQLFTHIRPQQQSSGNISRALFMFPNASNSHNNSFQEQNHHHHHHQQQQELQETLESFRFMPSLRSLEMREHDYGLIDSNVVVRPTLDLMQHPNSIFALRSNPTSSTSSSDEKCSFWKSLEGTGIA